MNIETRKLSFIQSLLQVKNEDIIIGLEKLLEDKQAEQYQQELKPKSLNEFCDEIDLALDDSENDRVISATELKKKWS